MDDDDYYPPESIISRIKILLKYKLDNIECVGSTLIGTYNIITDIRKRPQIKSIRETLTQDERVLVNNHLINNFPNFWLFLMILRTLNNLFVRLSIIVSFVLIIANINIYFCRRKKSC